MCLGDVGDLIGDVAGTIFPGLGGTIGKLLGGGKKQQVSIPAPLLQRRQEAQMADLKAYKKARKDANGTLLSGPSGIDLSAQNLGVTTLMGG